MTTERYCREVFHTTVEKWKSLPIQWRGFVLHNQHRQYNVDTTLDMIERTGASKRLSPQGVYDAYQGTAPA